MINIVKYVLEGLAVGLAINIMSHGKTSFSELFLIAITSMAVFLLLDVFYPLRASLMIGGGSMEEEMQTAGEPDMCGGGLLQALQTAGSVEPIVEKPAVQIPYKMISTDYGAGVLVAGFNEHADGYNADKLDNLAAF